MKIKICGLTTPEEADYVNKNRVDFVGVVMFFEKSRRNTTPVDAQRILAAVDSDIKKVAVMVSPTLEQVKLAENIGFDIVQIHGKLEDAILTETTIPVWKAFNISDMELFADYSKMERISGFVFDAAEPGSGKVFDWNIIKELKRQKTKLFILAGGLTAENVSRAIEAVRPDVVDVSTYVEYDDKRGKDPDKINRFVSAVRACKKQDTEMYKNKG